MTSAVSPRMPFKEMQLDTLRREIEGLKEKLAKAESDLKVLFLFLFSKKAIYRGNRNWIDHLLDQKMWRSFKSWALEPKEPFTAATWADGSAQ